MFWSSLKAKGKLYLCSLFALCAVLLCCASFAFVNIFGGSSVFKNENNSHSDTTASAAASSDIVTLTGNCANMATQWTNALAKSKANKALITVKLGANWTAVSNTNFTTSFGGSSDALDEFTNPFYCGALCVYSGANIVLDLNGYSLNRNLFTSANINNSSDDLINGGRVITVNGGTLEVTDGGSGGQITGGRAATEGGGVLLLGGANFTLSSGIIRNNKSYDGGAVRIRNNSRFVMNGGSISSNYAVSQSIINCFRGGSFIMNGGAISSNTCYSHCGSAIYTAQSGEANTVQLLGGQITGNISDAAGEQCAVRCNNSIGDTIVLENVIIANNTVKSSGISYGFTFGAMAKVTLKAGVQIYGHNNGDFYLPDGLSFTISGALNANGKTTHIGIKMAKPGAFSTGYGTANSSVNPSNYFFSNDTNYYVTNSGTGSSMRPALVAQPSTPVKQTTLTWQYSTNNSTWTSVANGGTSHTVNFSASKYYIRAMNGSSAITSFTKNFSYYNNAGTSKVTTNTISSYQTVGTYTFTAGSVSATAVNTYKNPSFTLKIEAKPITVSWSNTSFTYDGTNKTPTATASGIVSGFNTTIAVSGGQTNSGTYVTHASSCSNKNYYLPSNLTATLTINKANLKVSAFSYGTAPTYYGASSAPSKTIQRDGTTPVTITSGYGAITYSIASGDQNSTTYPGAATINASTGVLTGTKPGKIRVTMSIASAANYNAKTATVEVTVGKATLSDASTAYSGVYDGAAHTLTVSASGFKNSESFATAAGKTIKYRTASTGAYNLSEAPTRKDAGTMTVYYEITFTNYNTITGSKTVTVTKKALTAASTVADKVYDGNTTATVTVEAVTGVVAADDVTITAAGTFADKNVGSNIATTIAYTLSGTAAGNYSMANKTDATADITKKALTPTASINAKVYNAGTDGAGAISLSGAVNGEQPTATGTFVWSSANAGTTTYSVNSIALEGAWGTNYTLSTTTLSDLTAGTAIAKAEISGVEWDIPEDGYVYDGSEHQPKVNKVTTTATAGLPSDVSEMFTYSGWATDKGEHTVTAELKSDYAANYKITTTADGKTVSAAYTIGLATITLDSLVTLAYAGVYDGKKHKILTGMKASTAGDADNNLRWYWRIGEGAWTEFTSLTDANLAEVCNVSDSATYEIKITADNHKDLTFRRTVSITPRSLGTGSGAVAGIGGYTNVPKFTYDGTAHEFKPVLTDSVTEQDGGAGITTADYSFSYNNNIAAGVRTAVLTVTGANNYTGSFQVLYSIDPRAISLGTITVGGITDTVYNHSEQKESPELTDTVVGNALLTAGTDYTVSYQTPDGAEAADFTNVGTITVVITGAGNYTGTREVEYKITPYALDGEGSTASVAAVGNVVYTGSAHTPEPVVTVTHATAVTLGAGSDCGYTYTENVHAGTATITITGKGNYSGSITQTFVIEPKQISAISGITADDKVYDGTTSYTDAVQSDGTAAGIDYSLAVLDGNADGASLTVQTAEGVFTDKHAGSVNVVVTVTALGGAAAGDYSLPNGGVTVTVTGVTILQREISIEWHGLTHVYDGTDYKPTASVSNLVAGDTVTLVTRLKGADSAIAPGPYTVEISVDNSSIPSDYKLPSVIEALFNITTEGITARVDADRLTVTYDGAAKQPVVEQLNLDDQSWSAIPEKNESGAANYTLSYVGINGAALTDGKPVNAGEYKVTVKLSPNYSWSDVQPGDTREFTLKILPATITGVTLTGGVHTYNGTEYSLAVDWSGALINGAALGKQPEGVTVTYFYNGAADSGVVNAGAHTVVARFTVGGNYNAIADLSATLVINRAELALDGGEYNISFNSGSASYDGAKHTLVLSGTLPAGVTVTYEYKRGGQSYGSAGVTDVGEYNVTAIFAFANATDADNYKLTYNGLEIGRLEAVLTITKQSADVGDVVFEDATVVYDGAVHSLHVSGAATGVTKVAYEYLLNGVKVSESGVVNAGEYTVVARFEVGENYSPVAAQTRKLIITKAPLTVTAEAAVITYGDDPSAHDYEVSYTGVAAGDSVLDFGKPVIRVNSGKYSIYGPVGEYAEAIEVSGLTADNYEITYVYGTLTVKPKVVAVTWYRSSERKSQDLTYTYEDGLVYTPYADVTNAVRGETLIIRVAGGTGAVGMNHEAVATGIYLADGVTPASNYALPTAGLKTTFDILPKPPKRGKIVWDNAPLYYNGTAQAPRAYYYADENANTPEELTVTTNRTAVGVGEYTATVVAFSGVELVGEQSRTFKILAREVYIEIADATQRLGGVDLGAIAWAYADGSAELVAGEQYAVTFVVDGKITVAGKYAIEGRFTCNTPANYEVHFTGSWADGKRGTLTVTEGEYDMSGVRYTGLEATYDGQAHIITATGLPAGVTAEYEYVLNGWSLGVLGRDNFAGAVNAGEYEVIIRFTCTLDGYAKLPELVKTLRIRKAGLTVKANDHSIVYGDAAQTNGVTYSIDGIESSLSGAAVLVTDYEQYGAAGRYKITVAGLGSDNYEISYVPGTLTVKPRELTVTWYTDASASVVYDPEVAYDYDGREHMPYAVAGGTLRGERVTLTVETDGGAQSEAGLNYTARITGVSSGNYAVKAEDASVKFSIIDKNVVMWDNSELEYNGNGQYPQAWYYDDAGKHELSDYELLDASGAVIAEAVDAGDYTVRLTNVPAGISGETSKGFKITPKRVTVEIGTGELVYGDVSGKLDGLLDTLKNTLGGADGFIAADGIPVKLGADVSDTSNVGEYAVTGEGTNNNYIITVIAGSIGVVKADIDEADIGFAGGVAQRVEYDGRAHALRLETEDISGVTRVTYKYYKDGAEIAESEVIGVGEYTVEALFTVDGNHNAVAGSYTATLTITAKTNTGVTFVDDTVVYDGAEHSLYVGGDASGIVGVSYEYVLDGVKVSDKGAVNAGEYTVTARFETAEGYTPIADKRAKLTITKATLTVTAKNGAVEYGAAASADGYGYTVTGLALADDADAVLGAVVYSYNYSVGDNVGEYTVTVTGVAQTDNYSVTYKTGKLIVSPKTLTENDVVWYDELGGAQLGADGRFVYEYAAGVMRRPYAASAVAGLEFIVGGGAIDAGYGYEAEIVGLTGSAAGNYKLPASGLKVSYDILPKPLNGTIVWDDTPLYYNGAVQKPTVWYYDDNGTRYEFETVTVEGDSINAGEYIARVSLDGINYTLTGATEQRFTILPRRVYIEIADMECEYGVKPDMGAVGYKFINGSGFVGGESYTLTFTTGTITGVGEYAIAGAFVSANADNYEVIFSGSYATSDAHSGECGTLRVVKAVYDMSKTTFAGLEATYDGGLHSITVNGLPEGVTAVCEYVAGGFKHTDGARNAGVYTVTVRFTGDENHEPIADRYATLTVKKASLIIKAADSVIEYGESAAYAGVTYTGFMGGDTAETAGVLTGGLAYACDYTRGGNVGEYTIIPSGYSSANYDIIYKTGTLRVNPKTITVSWYDDETLGGRTFVYPNDGKYYAPYAVAGGLVNGDTVVLTVTGAKNAQGFNYVATAVLDNGNYALPTDGSATQKFTIMPKAGSIVWDNTPLYYNGLSQTPKAYYFDADGTRHEVTGVSVYNADEAVNAGKYTATVVFDGESRFCPFEILPLEIRVEIGSPTQAVPYGASPVLDQQLWSYASGSAHFVAGNPVRLETAAVAGSAVGEYAITGVCTDGNYKVTFVAGVLKICKATIDISGVDCGGLSVNYDGSEHCLEVTGLPAGIAGVICTYEKDGVSYGTSGVRDAGEYSVTIRFILTSSASYEAVGDITKTFTIRAITPDMSGVRFDGESKTVAYNGAVQSILASGSAAGVTGVAYTYYEADGVTPVAGNAAVDAGVYKVKAEFTFGANYDGSAVAAQWAELIIEQAELTVTADAASVVYGDGVDISALTYTVNGLAGADTATAVLGAVTMGVTGYSVTDAVGEYAGAVTVSGNTSNKNYKITYKNGKLTVTPREVTIEGWQKSATDTDTLLEYEYDGSEHIPYAVAGNVANGDMLVIRVEVAKSGAGVNYLATATAVLNADGTVNTNYVLSADADRRQTEFTVKYATDVAYEIIWNYSAEYYDGTAKKPAAEYYDGETGAYVGVNAENIKIYELDGVTEAEALHAGRYIARVMISDGKTYTHTETEFEVLRRKVYVTVGDGTSRYGTAPDLGKVGWSYATGNADNKFLAGDEYKITLNTDAGIFSDVGSYAIRAEYAGSADYEVVFTGGSYATGDAHNGEYGTLTVEKAVYDMSRVTIGGLKAVYDGAAHKVEALNLPAGVVAEYVYERGGWSYADGAVDAGEYVVTVTFTGNPNYEAIPSVTAVLTVAKAKLTVTANDHSIVYGDAPEAGGVRYTGFAGSDSEHTAGVLGGALSYEYGYVRGGSVGEYTITPKGLTSVNYEITYLSGILTVEKRTVTVNWFNDERMNSMTLQYPYDGAAHMPYAEAGNVLDGDSVILTVTGGQTEAGIGYKAEVTGVSNGNYRLPATGAEASFDILPEANVIVWEATPFVFDNTPHVPKAYYFTVNGERVELNVSVKRNWGASDSSGTAVFAGEYLAVARLAGGNVTLTGEWEHRFTIAKRKVTVVINDAGTAYGEEIAFNGWTYGEGSDEFIGGSAPVYLSSSVNKASGVGTYEITGVYAGSDNSYEVTFVNGTYTVSKAVVNVPEILGKVYTGGLLKADVTDTAVYRVYQNDGGINVGYYKVILEILDYDNYKWQVNGTDIRSANYTVMFEIIRAVNVFETEFAVRSIKAGEAISITEPAAKFGAAVVEYYKDAACTGDKVDVTGNRWNDVEGTYYAKVYVAGTDNYEGLERIYAFTVTGKLVLDLYWGEVLHEYNGAAWLPKAYVMLDGREIELSVSGVQTNAGVYTAEASLIAKDGTDLSKYKLAGSAETRFEITPKELTVYIKDMDSVYGEAVKDVNLWSLDNCEIEGGLAGADNRASLNLSFYCSFGGEEYVKAGRYAIHGSCGNGNYKVAFAGEDGSVTGTYTVREAEIGVLKNGTAWFDEQGVIGEYQNEFIVLGDTNPDGSYKYLNVKGGQRVTITYSTFIDKYKSTVHDNMTEDTVKLFFADGGQPVKPEINQGGSWVVYYKIQAESHTDRYGVWKVLIEDPDDFVIITFVRPYRVQYGDVVGGRNILPELVEQGCIKLSGKVVPDTQTLLRVAEAFAYEDVQNGVNAGTGVNSYAIRLNFNSTGMLLYGDKAFKYSSSNTPDSDTNLDKFEVVRRKLTVNWTNTEFTANGGPQLPEIEISGFVGGQSVKLDGYAIGEPVMLTLDNGDTVNVTILHTDGDASMSEASYTLKAVIDNDNYTLEGDSKLITVKPAPPVKGDDNKLPLWAIVTIAAGGAVLLIILIISIVAASKRRTVIVTQDDTDGFNDNYVE